MKAFAPKGPKYPLEQIFPFRIDPFSEWDKSSVDRFVSPESYPFPLRLPTVWLRLPFCLDTSVKKVKIYSFWINK